MSNWSLVQHGCWGLRFLYVAGPVPVTYESLASLANTRMEPRPPAPPPLPAGAAVVDQQKRIFLFQYEDSGRSWWATPGGGLEGDETFEEAATREAMEELFLAGVALVPIWRQTVDFTFRARRIHQVEQYFMVRPLQPDGSLLDVVGEAHRSESIVAGRWWSAEELETTSEQIFPEDLRERLAELTAC